MGEQMKPQTIVRRFPPLAQAHTGMRVSAVGLLGRIRDGRYSPDHDFGCGELLKHLDELASRYYSGDLAVVDEFLQLYCLDKNRPVPAPQERESTSSIAVDRKTTVGLDGVERWLDNNDPVNAPPRDDATDAKRYRYLRERDLNTIRHGGVFAGMTPQNMVLNGEDLDWEVDKGRAIQPDYESAREAKKEANLMEKAQ